jgi:uncharacterized cupredoxin-like copper-binding protein
MSVLHRRIAGVMIGAALLALIAAAIQPAGMPLGATGSPAASPETACATPVASPNASPVSLEGSEMRTVAETVTIELTDGGYVPNYVQATSGHDLTITLKNTGTRDHGFAIDYFDIDETLAPGESKTITIHNREEIDVDYYSSAPCDEGMTGTLTFYI